MDSPFPVVDANQPVDGIVKLLSKSTPAVLVESASLAGETRHFTTLVALAAAPLPGECEKLLACLT